VVRPPQTVQGGATPLAKMGRPSYFFLFSFSIFLN
jgi:hypothetical protein